jgi:dTMP kinase
MRAGRFIVLEGGDGVGKSTQAALLSSFMDARGIPHVLTREPGGTPVGEAIRELLLGRADFDMPAETELLLMLAARATFVRDVVRPALAEGKVVLADRFSLSTLAYQGYGRGLDLDDVREAIRIATGGLDADLYVVLDLPASNGMACNRIESSRREMPF